MEIFQDVIKVIKPKSWGQPIGNDTSHYPPVQEDVIYSTKILLSGTENVAR